MAVWLLRLAMATDSVDSSRTTLCINHRIESQLESSRLIESESTDSPTREMEYSLRNWPQNFLEAVFSARMGDPFAKPCLHMNDITLALFLLFCHCNTTLQGKKLLPLMLIL